MLSGTSLYNRGFGKNLLKRSWPLWAAYLLVLIFTLPVSVESYLAHGSDPFGAASAVLYSAVNMVDWSFFFCCASAMVVFSFMYSSRSCGMVCSMPMKRETVFSTCCITGLVPMFICDVLVFGVTAAIFAFRGEVEMRDLGTWLGTAILANTAFFGLAAVLAMLTGRLMVLSGVYVLLNVAVYALEAAVKAVLDKLIYGHSGGDMLFTWLSPIIMIDESLGVSDNRYAVPDEGTGVAEGVYLSGVGVLAIYAAVGLALIGLALWLYKTRRMETAGDTVAIPVLRPVFTYFMAIGGAVSFAAITGEMLNVSGRGVWLTETALMLIGAAIGFYAAKMLIKRTVWVFRGGVKELLISMAVVALFAVGAEFGMTGYEKYVPDESDIESVKIEYDVTLSSPESIRDAAALHRGIISHKSENEQDGGHYWIILCYRLRDGSTLRRRYGVVSSDKTMADANSDIRSFEALMNNPEAMHYRNSFKTEMTENSTLIAWVDASRANAGGYYDNDRVKLKEAQTMELYEAVMEDVKAGDIGRFTVGGGNEDEESVRYNISFELMNPPTEEPVLYREEAEFCNRLYFYVTPEAARTRLWLRENGFPE